MSELRVRKGEPYLPISDELSSWWQSLGLTIAERGMMVELLRVQLDGYVGARAASALHACSMDARSTRSVDRLICKGALLQTEQGIEVARYLDYYLSSAERRAKMQAQTAEARAARQRRARD